MKRVGVERTRIARQVASGSAERDDVNQQWRVDAMLSSWLEAEAEEAREGLREEEWPTGARKLLKAPQCYLVLCKRPGAANS